jgi:tetratricopeptide (TPR) repeat protein
LSLVLLVGSLLVAPPIGAQPPPRRVTESQKAEARDLYKKGMTHYELGSFEEAIDEFKRAYELTKAPGLLFNLAQVYRLKKDWEQARFFYKTYLRVEPAAANRADGEALIGEAEERQKAAEREAAHPPEPPPAPVLTPPPPVLVAPLQAPTPPPPPRPRPWRGELAAFGVLAGSGLGALAAGIVLNVRATSLASALGNESQLGTSTWDVQHQATYRDGQQAALAGALLDGAGALLLAGGAVAGYFGFRDRAHARPRYVLSPTFGGVVLTCGF